MKRIVSFTVSIIMLLSLFVFSYAEEVNIKTEDFSDVCEYLETVGSGVTDLGLSSKSAVLVEADTGSILYSENADEKLPPASVTKIMTLLLIMESLSQGKIKLTDKVSTSERAASMGGTQIYLEVGEEMCVNDLIKAISIPSANDAAVAMAEHLCGSEDEFVAHMNEKAKSLGMKNTNFTNCTGLFDDENHYSTATDIAIMTRALIQYPKIFDYSTVWMDTLRDGGFGLANTNKMLKTYKGMNGMKTGYTKLSKHCFSGTAKRDGMQLIAVVLGGPTSKDRFNDTAKLLDFGFANFSVYKDEGNVLSPIEVVKGKEQTVEVKVKSGFSVLVGKGQSSRVEKDISLAPSLVAPVEAGTEVGSINYSLNGKVIKTIPIVTSKAVPKAGFCDYFVALLKEFTNIK